MSDDGRLLPLSGYRVLDFGTAWAGPMAGQLLADMGAEVIKVESRTHLDGLRMGRPLMTDDTGGGDKGKWPERQPLFHCINRNKLGVTLDYKRPEGLAVLKRLVAKADIIVHNYSPGVLDRAGLGFEELTRIKQDIIVVSMPAAGESGPLKQLVAYAYSVLALSGIGSVLGYEDEGPLPLGAGAYCDTLAALCGANAAMVALYHRNETGEGQYVEIPQWEATTSLFVEGLMQLQMNGHVPTTIGNTHRTMVPHGNYRCAGDDAWVSIAVSDEREWEALCDALGQADWRRDPRFSDAAARRRNRRELDDLIDAWTATRSGDDIALLLQRVGVAAMPLRTIESAYLDPHHQERAVYRELEHPEIGTETLPGFAWRFSDVPFQLRRAAPTLGQDNDHVFGEIVGLTPEEIRRLTDARVLY